MMESITVCASVSINFTSGSTGRSAIDRNPHFRDEYPLDGILVKVHRLDLTPRLVSTDRARRVRGRTRSRGRYRVREIVGVQAELASEGHRVAHRRENGRHVLDDLLAHGRGREVDRHGERFDLDGHDGTSRSESDTSATSTLPRLSIRRCSSASLEITQSPRKSPPM